MGTRIIVFLLCALIVFAFAWNVHQYYSHSDDCYISFRYALNLTEGHGLVWNPGERVEGYTNFLWVLLMALGMLLGVPPEILSNMIGVASGVAVLVFVLYFSSRRLKWDSPLVWLAALLLSTSRSFTAWCSGGLATMFFTMLVFVAFLRFLRERETEAKYPVGSSLLLAASSLTRPEATLFALVAAAFFAAEVLFGKRKMISFIVWVLPLVLVVGAHLIWRNSYYGYWLPNSFYANVSGFWGRQAYHYFSLFHQDYKILYFLPLVLLPVVLTRKFVHCLFVAVIAAHAGYLTYIGGDRFEFRFLVFVFPYFYLLMTEGICLSISLLRSSLPRYATLMVAFAVSGALVAATHSGSVRPEAKKTRHDVVSIEEMRAYASRRVNEGKFLRSLVDQGLLPDDIVLCVSGAGAVPYYTRWPTVDLLGINDVRIAHQQVRRRGIVGHEKRGSLEYLRERKVELFDRKNRIVHRYRGESYSCRTDIGCWKSIRVGGFYLNFMTFLPDSDFELRFGKLLRANSSAQ